MQTPLSRRQFLKGLLLSAGSLTTANSLATQLQLSNVLSANRFSDYKAMVCIFLYGGHDSFNLLVPTDTAQYQAYAQTRQSLAYAQADLRPLQQNDVAPMAMHQQAAGLVDLFNRQRLSVVTNMGPMRAPASKAEIQANWAALTPPQLFSHNDQQTLWQNATMNADAIDGWGGRMADLLMDSQQSLPLSFSLGGTNLFQSGRVAQHYVMNTDGVEQFGGLNPQHEWNNLRIAHYQRLLADATDPFTKAYADKLLAVRENNLVLSTALADVAASSVSYPSDNDLASQLQMIAKVMQAQAALGQNRQIFFASLGGFDTHDNQAVLLPQLQATLADALLSFEADIQARGLTDSVVTFTQSEFGRTLTSNGDGTDHGWAGHQLVMGGPVDGGRILGHLPEQVIDTEDDLGDGRIIPTTSIEQFGAQLAQWFGLSQSEINDVFPHFSTFGPATFNLFR